MCWFAMWDGNGTWWKGAHGDDPFDDDRDRVLRNTPRVHTESRDYFLMRGPLRAILPLFNAAGGQSPTLWWPESRTWLISTEVDALSSYMGAFAELIDDLLQSENIEPIHTHVDARLDWGI